MLLSALLISVFAHTFPHIPLRDAARHKLAPKAPSRGSIATMRSMTVTPTKMAWTNSTLRRNDCR